MFFEMQHRPRTHRSSKDRVDSLTEYREDDDYKVEDIPRLLEVEPSQTDNLHDAFESEDDDKDGIDEAQTSLEFFRLFVMFESHGNHV